MKIPTNKVTLSQMRYPLLAGYLRLCMPGYLCHHYFTYLDLIQKIADEMNTFKQSFFSHYNEISSVLVTRVLRNFL